MWDGTDVTIKEVAKSKFSRDVYTMLTQNAHRCFLVLTITSLMGRRMLKTRRILPQGYISTSHDHLHHYNDANSQEVDGAYDGMYQHSGLNCGKSLANATDRHVKAMLQGGQRFFARGLLYKPYRS